MPKVDPLSLEEMRAWRPEVAEPADFDAFWTATLDESRAAGGDAVLRAEPTPFTLVDVYDLVFPGFAGDPVRAWVTVPAGPGGPLPAVVEFLGYGGGRGLPGARLFWANAGYAHVLMDTRGQGSAWGSGGDTDDPHGAGPAFPGFMTRGILDRRDYYYRRVFTDGVRLVDAVRGLPFVDPSRLVVTGGSQGGAITLAVAGLSDGLVGVMPDVPFLCHMRWSVERTPRAPFTEVVQWLSVHRDVVDDAFRTLSYFDGVNFARRVNAPSLFSVALLDDIVLPSSVFAAYNVLGAQDRSIEVYPFNGHEQGELHQLHRQAAWLAERVPV
ncbi:MAG: acetylxylan esterase [Microbacteriaceae bacterium]|nr:acetylxylan esterase [Microbacteriaceae bacterium]